MQQAESRAQALEEVLREFMIRCGNLQSRTALAERLAAERMTVERLRLLCEVMEGRGKPAAETAAMIGQVLKTKASWLEFVKDLEFARVERRRRRVPDRNMPDLAVEPARIEREFREYVVERINVDGKSVAELAHSTGRSVEYIDQMLTHPGWSDGGEGR